MSSDYLVSIYIFLFIYFVYIFLLYIFVYIFCLYIFLYIFRLYIFFDSLMLPDECGHLLTIRNRSVATKR